MPEGFDEEMLRLAKVLAEAVRFSHRTRQSLEQELGFSAGSLSKVFHGKTVLGLKNLLRILDALGISPKDFFAVAYEHAESSAEGKRIIRELAESQGGPKADDEDFDQRVRDALSRILGTPPPR